MAVKDLQARQGSVEIELDVVDVGDIREFEKFGKKGRVANAICKDESGDIKVSLWNEQIDQVKAGDKVKITNGYVSEWQGELQLTTGKFGKLEVLSESEETKKEATAMPDPEKSKQVLQEAEKKIEEEYKEPVIEEEDIE